MKIIALFGLALVQISIATDYCASDLCSGRTHIGCNNDGAFYPACPADAEIVVLSEADKKAIVADHNAKRNFIAGGGDSKLSPACNMPTMKYDDELASLAVLNTLQCEMVHDSCRNTDNFKFAGQNLAYLGYQEPINVTDVLIKASDMWYSERVDTYQEHIDAYPMGYTGPVIGHFTGMVGDLNDHVGCGIVKFDWEGYPTWKKMMVACNYANTNVVGFPIYDSCSVAASRCSKGVNCEYGNLCHPNEPVDPNDIWG